MPPDANCPVDVFVMELTVTSANVVNGREPTLVVILALAVKAAIEPATAKANTSLGQMAVSVRTKLGPFPRKVLERTTDDAALYSRSAISQLTLSMLVTIVYVLLGPLGTTP